MLCWCGPRYFGCHQRAPTTRCAPSPRERLRAVGRVGVGGRACGTDAAQRTAPHSRPLPTASRGEGSGETVRASTRESMFQRDNTMLLLRGLDLHLGGDLLPGRELAREPGLRLVHRLARHDVE